VRIVAEAPTALEIETRSETPAFLVASDIFYPGWKATLDGEEVPIQRTNYVLRGIELPPGRHRVRFSYEPLSVIAGGAISLAVALALVGVAAGRLVSRRRHRRFRSAALA